MLELPNIGNIPPITQSRSAKTWMNKHLSYPILNGGIVFRAFS
uniref:Uncharacterized protein n=1 Tax=Pectobacterium carotovorum TaxID=554 RepID=A0A0N9NLM8_PECCA|nr:Hypothetical protein [Pectobacterium carotovorum]